MKENPGPGPGPELPVGEILRRTRLHYGQSLVDIERVLRIKASQIEAIELGHYERLPGRVYAIGFVRTYAEYLGLDSEKMLALLKEQSAVQVVRTELHFPVPASESKVPNLALVIGSLVLAVAVVALWWSLQNSNRALVTEIPPVPEAIQAKTELPVSASGVPAGPPAPVSVSTGAATSPPPADAAQEQAQKGGIILKIIRNSWVEIKDESGKAVVSRVLKVGDKYFVPDSPGLLMSLGNSGGVELEIDGRSLGTLGANGEVMRNISLDVQLLKKKFAKPVAKSPQ